MHDPRCHVEQLRQGHRTQMQMLQRELQLLREKNAAVLPQHHHRYGVCVSALQYTDPQLTSENSQAPPTSSQSTNMVVPLPSRQPGLIIDRAGTRPLLRVPPRGLAHGLLPAAVPVFPRRLLPQPREAGLLALVTDVAVVRPPARWRRLTGVVRMAPLGFRAVVRPRGLRSVIRAQLRPV